MNVNYDIRNTIFAALRSSVEALDESNSEIRSDAYFPELDKIWGTTDTAFAGRYVFLNIHNTFSYAGQKSAPFQKKINEKILDLACVAEVDLPKSFDLAKTNDHIFIDLDNNGSLVDEFN